MKDELGSVLMDNIPILGIDTETTGFSRKDDIVEISCVLMWKDEVIDEFTTLVGETRYVPEEVTAIHGITSEMLDSAPRWSEIEERLLTFLHRGAPIVAHNMSFDARMIQKYMKRKWPLSTPTICTKILGRRIHPQLKSHSLGEILKHFDIDLEGAHRARADAIACARLARKLTRGRTIAECMTRRSEDWGG